MRLELKDSVLKRAWVAKAWDARSHKACWEFVEREDFNKATFYLADGIYCVSGGNRARDPNRWLRIHNGKSEWCEYKDIAPLVSADTAKVRRSLAGKKVAEYTLRICCQCEEIFLSPKGTEPYRILVDWEREEHPIYEPVCESCGKEREWHRANHYHECSYCQEVLRLIEQPRGANCHLCQMMINPADVKDWSELTCSSCSAKSDHSEDEWWQR
jgi:hypothetical protein